MSTTSAPVTGSWRRCEHGLKRAVIRTLRETRELLGGYRLGRQLGRARRGEIALTETQWTELEGLGTRRNVNDLSAGDRLMAEMRAWLEAGGDPNPQGNFASFWGLSPRKAAGPGTPWRDPRSPRPSGPNSRHFAFLDAGRSRGRRSNSSATS